jgi:hypothetical protein
MKYLFPGNEMENYNLVMLLFLIGLVKLYLINKNGKLCINQQGCI